jgi:GR25 family glycosyltransferase involved in LPS biosynthesis
MLFNTYVINLENEFEKWNNIKFNLEKIGIRPIRFNAIHGKKIDINDHNSKIMSFCKYTCPYSVIGCGLSHIYLNEFILNNDPYEFALVLEDDAIPQIDCKNSINKIINENKNYDYISLYCQGICNKFPYIYSSTAAYLI